MGIKFGPVDIDEVSRWLVSQECYSLSEEYESCGDICEEGEEHYYIGDRVGIII